MELDPSSSSTTVRVTTGLQPLQKAAGREAALQPLRIHHDQLQIVRNVDGTILGDVDKEEHRPVGALRSLPVAARHGNRARLRRGGGSRRRRIGVGHDIAALSHALSVPVERIEQTYLKGMGCKECAGTGYRGRVGLFELLEITEELQRIILKGGDRNQINKAALQGGMVSLKMDGLEKVKQGITTYEEILRVAR